ncbi:MAG TPA: ABC transporter ATP-binding protein [Vicinamibacterales bacterium]|nr:ABC transporter ATP-binding protein [Vicinamibacterales bacterium]
MAPCGGRPVSAIVTACGLAWRAGESVVVDGVTFDIGPGEFVALMGRNGTGKTTVMDLLAGLRRPDAGAVVLAGRPLEEWPAVERARRIGHLPQTVRTQSLMTVEQIVMMGRYPHRDRRSVSDRDRDVAERAMRDCDCLRFRHRRLSTLSGGERQRVLLAACIAQEPMLLLLDEPSTFLDVDQQLQSFATLRALVDQGAACLAVSHDLNLALTFCTRIIVLADHTIARDMAVETATQSDDWLPLFSQRLRLLALPHGRSWVAYR